MNLHEYQSKQLFRKYGLPVPDGQVVSSPSEVESAVTELGGERWVCKTQVHAGGRGKAGGVRLVSSVDEARDFAEHWIGRRLVTKQTDAQGQPVDSIYIEPASDIASEMYLGCAIDRSSQRVVVMASSEGGVDIETVAAETPEKVFKVAIDPVLGAQQFQGRSLAYKLGLENDQVPQFTSIFLALSQIFQDEDCSLVEVNPLVVTSDRKLLCVDAKINIDSNALYRHPDTAAMRDERQEDEREAQAAEFNLSYVALDGNIGCMVNGAGLAMGTMDLVKTHGGNPANFLDVGGGVSQESVGEAFKIILADPKVKAVLINIFGGIVSCATIAEGIVGALQDVGVEVPVVVRFDGSNAERGTAILRDSGLDVITATSLRDAAQQAVEAANTER